MVGQQLCNTSFTKKIFEKVLGGYFLNHPRRGQSIEMLVYANLFDLVTLTFDTSIFFFFSYADTSIINGDVGICQVVTFYKFGRNIFSHFVCKVQTDIHTYILMHGTKCSTTP